MCESRTNIYTMRLVPETGQPICDNKFGKFSIFCTIVDSHGNFVYSHFNNFASLEILKRCRFQRLSIIIISSCVAA